MSGWSSFAWDNHNPPRKLPALSTCECYGSTFVTENRHTIMFLARDQRARNIIDNRHTTGAPCHSAVTCSCNSMQRKVLAGLDRHLQQLTGRQRQQSVVQTCSLVARVSMSFCTARVPWVLRAAVTSLSSSEAFCSTCPQHTSSSQPPQQQQQPQQPQQQQQQQSCSGIS